MTAANREGGTAGQTVLLPTFPALAWTTSVPPSWVLLVRASISSEVRATLGVACRARGEHQHQVDTGRAGAQGQSFIYLGEQGQDGDARMAADDGHIDARDIEALLLGVEGLGAHHVQRRDTQHLALVVHAQLLERLGGDRDSRVDRVGDDVENGLWGRCCVASAQGRECYTKSRHSFTLHLGPSSD